MSLAETANAKGIFIDIGQTMLRAWTDGEAFSFPLERGEDGRLTVTGRERLTAGLREFLNRKGGAGRIAYCAISARGVSMRRLTLPSSNDDELRRMLRLQIESEFPVPCDQLAWGWRRIGAAAAADGAVARQEVLVAAVKKDALEDVRSVLVDCGVSPVFTPAALARVAALDSVAETCALFDIGRSHSEILLLEKGAPVSIRLLPWGGENITRAIQERLAVGRDEAERLKLALDEPSWEFTSQGRLVQQAALAALAYPAKMLKGVAPGSPIFLTGKSARQPSLALMLGGLLESHTFRSAAATASSAPSLAISGLMKSVANNGAIAPLVLEDGAGAVAARPTKMGKVKWAATAGALAVAVLLFPYVEALIGKPFLEKKLTRLEVDRGRLATIDEELDFLKFVKQNQFPALDAIYLISKAVPQGTQLESVSMGRHQDVALRLKLNDSQQVTEFRSKLVDSGWFNNVVVEDQTPGMDRRVSVRMTATLRPAEARKALPVEPPSIRKAGDEPKFAMPEPMMAPHAPQPSPGPAPEPPDASAPKPPRPVHHRIIINPQ